MKSFVLIYNGAADEPLPAMQDRTPLQTVRASNTCRMASTGQAGLLENHRRAPEDSHTLLAELFGASAESVAAFRRGPLRAAALQIETSLYDAAFCADFVTLRDGCLHTARVPELSMEETTALCETLREQSGPELQIYPVSPSCAVLLFQSSGAELMTGEAPEFRAGSRPDRYLARFKNAAAPLRDLMVRAREILEHHPVNEVRRDLGEPPAELLWLWGGGPLPGRTAGEPRPDRVLFTNSAVARGLAVQMGMAVYPLGNPWKIEKDRPLFRLPELMEAVRRYSLIFFYLEAPFGLGDFGGALEKKMALEAADRMLLEPLLPVIESCRPCRTALISDMLFSSVDGVPVPGDLPFVITGEELAPDGIERWSEVDCAAGSLGTLKTAVFKNMIGSSLPRP